MALYINGIGCISPQHTFDNAVFLPEIREYSTNKIYCIDPDYTKFFDAGSIRRMGHLLKFGTAAGLLALKDAGIKLPGAISTGTGYGLIEVSQKFLTDVIQSAETMVSPTSFIQSTHNTVSSNIALLCGCNAHNNTFSQKWFSFESALSDARLLAAEGIDDMLVGAYDEISSYHCHYLRETGELRAEPSSNLDIYGQKSNGIIAGEGAAFFVLANRKCEGSYGKLIEFKTLYKPESVEEIKAAIDKFLVENELNLKTLDVVICGINGNRKGDEIAIAVNEAIFSDQTILAYKHLCGEYMTSSAFAFWLASKMMRLQHIPNEVILENRNRQPKNILFYNANKDHHSLMLFKAC